MYGYLKDDKIILNFYFFRKKILKNRRRKIYCTKSKIYEKMNKPKISYICDKTLLVFSFCNKCGSEDEQTFRAEESTELLKTDYLINDIDKYQKIYNHV